MYQKLLLFFLLIVPGLSIQAQSVEASIPERPTHNFLVNGLGEGSLISLSFEKLFFIHPGLFISGELGVGYSEEFQLFSSGSSQPGGYITFPHHLTANLGKGRHFFECGIGGIIIGGKPSQSYYLFPILGYRIQPLQSNQIVFRIYGNIPVTGLETEDMLFSPLGISVGVAF